MNMLKWEFAAVTDVGCKRTENQDNFFVSDDRRLFVIADGMGGEFGGATASRLAVEAIEKMWNTSPPQDEERETIHRWLVEAVSNANESVFSAAIDEMHRMGTTIVVAMQTSSADVHVAHVGDSRAYLIREGKTIVLTQDHSLVMDLMLAGKLTQEQFENSPFKNYLTRCVGHNNNVEIDHSPCELRPGDTLMMCTDGLTGVVRDEQIGEIVKELDEPHAVCNELLRRAIAGGAPDNVTIIAIRYSTTTTDSEHPQELAKSKG
jgi:protein phosphatase